MTDQTILLVDDEPQLLEGLQRHLRKRFSIEIAVGGQQGLSMIRDKGPFAVIISDMQMPDMNGVEFLSICKRIAPDSIRMMLTGNSDQATAVEAVNTGSVFRFLSKPCSASDITIAIESALNLNRAQTLEREVMVQTVTGSIGLLSELFSILQPNAAGRVNNIKTVANEIACRLKCLNDWEIRIASSLCHIGFISVPSEIVQKFLEDHDFSAAELTAFKRHAVVGERLVNRIPRLDGVARMIGSQFAAGLPKSVHGSREHELEVGGSILRLAVDFDAFRGRNCSSQSALQLIEQYTDRYYAPAVGALREWINSKEVILMLKVSELCDGMIVDEDILSLRGDLLIARGQMVVESLRERLYMFSISSQVVREPFRVRCNQEHLAASKLA